MKSLRRLRKDLIRERILESGLNVVYHCQPALQLEALFQLSLNKLAQYENRDIQQVYRSIYDKYSNLPYSAREVEE